MGKFGDRLRRERKAKGISLESMAASTKISTRMLAALEEEKFHLLPGGVFNRGFVRSYATFVGINEEEAVAEYVAAAGPIEAPADGVDPKLEKTLANWKRPEGDESSRRNSSWAPIAVLVVVAAVAFAGYRVVLKKRSSANEIKSAILEQISKPNARIEAPPAPRAPEPPPPSLTNSAESASTAPITSPPTSEAQHSVKPEATVPPAAAESTPAKPKVSEISRKTETASVLTPAVLSKQPSASTENVPEESDSTISGPVALTVRAKEDSWISITADGRVVFKDLLKASDERSIEAQEKIVVILGNAGGVEVSYNGRTLPPLGRSRKVKTLTFRPDGYQ